MVERSISEEVFDRILGHGERLRPGHRLRVLVSETVRHRNLDGAAGRRGLDPEEVIVLLGLDESAWARGQAWVLYGYTMMFRETGEADFLAHAEKVARMLLERLPEDGICSLDSMLP